MNQSYLFTFILIPIIYIFNAMLEETRNTVKVRKDEQKLAGIFEKIFFLALAASTFILTIMAITIFLN